MPLSEMKAQMVVWLDLMKFKRPDWDRYFEFTDAEFPTDSTIVLTRGVLHLFTEKCHYMVNFSWKHEGGYLGCIASQRTPRPGETHSRGNDLFDGPFNHDTWTRILADIVSYELVSAVKDYRGGSIRPTEPETKGPPAPSPFGDPYPGGLQVTSIQGGIMRFAHETDRPEPPCAVHHTTMKWNDAHFKFECTTENCDYCVSGETAGMKAN